MLGSLVPRLRRLALPLACLSALGVAACYSAPDKRVYQYLNTDGFGNRYTGNAEEENWVGINDKVTYADSWNDSVSGSNLSVGIDGTIIVPEVGAVHVAGLTRTEIEALLTQKLAPYYKRTDIRVKITANAKEYFVFGEVGGQGKRPLYGDLTVFEAVMSAKPDPNKANLARVRIIRADPRDPLIFTVNVAQMLRTGDSTYNVLIQEKDIVVVPPTLFAQIGYFISDLITPFTEVLRSITNAFRFNRGRNFGNVFPF